MPMQIFVNLPVTDLPHAMDFWRALGFDFNATFTNDDAACLVFSDTIFAMLHTHASFARFTPLPVADAHRSTEVMLALSCESREAVEAMVATALAHGGSAHRDAEDHGFMFAWSFRDPDGHIWEPLHLVAMPDEAR